MKVVYTRASVCRVPEVSYVSFHMIKALGGGRRLPFVLEQSEKNPLCTSLLTMSALVTVTSVRVSTHPRRDTGAFVCICAQRQRV